MHSMAYQLRSWDANKVDRGAGVYRTFQILPSHVAIAQSRPTEGDVDDQLLCCARDGIIAEEMMRYTS
jgi:hypothetical protein